MTAQGTVYVEDIATQIVPYDQIKVYRGSSPTGAFTTLVQTLTLVAGTEAYAFTDSAGTINTLWRASYYNSGTAAESSLGPLIRPGGLTLRVLRLLGAQRAGAAFKSAAVSGATSPASLIDTALLDNGMDTGYLEGAWVYRPDAANASDKVRRVKKAGFNITTGALAFSRDYTVAPAAAEEYHVYQFFPPIDQPGVPRSWDQVVRDALNGRWFIDQVTLGQGDGHTRRYSLATFADVTESTFRRAFLRTTNTNGDIIDISAHTNGRFVTPVSNAGAFSLDFWPAPSSRQEIIVECLRTDDALYVDTDTTSLSQRRAECAVEVEAYAALRKLQPGKYEAEYRAALDDLAAEEDIHRPTDMVLGV